MAAAPNPEPPGGFPRRRFDVEAGRLVADDEVLPPTVGGGPLDEASEALARDEAALALYSGMLADAVVAALPGWIERSVRERAAQAGVAATDDAVAEVARHAADQAVLDVGPRLRRLLATDLDHQGSTPLEIVRSAVVHATAALRSLGVPPVVRDAQDEALLPDDEHALAPAALADVDEALAEVGIRWGAAKAHVHLARRRAEGQA